MRERTVEARCFFGNDRADCGFVFGVRPRVQEHDRDRFDVVGVEPLRDARGVCAIEHGDDVAVGVEAFDDLERAMARNVGFRPFEEEVVCFGTAAAPDLVDVAHALGDDEGGARPRAFDRRVDGDGRAVDERLGGIHRQTALSQRFANADR